MREGMCNKVPRPSCMHCATSGSMMPASPNWLAKVHCHSASFTIRLGQAAEASLKSHAVLAAARRVRVRLYPQSSWEQQGQTSLIVNKQPAMSTAKHWWQLAILWWPTCMVTLRWASISACRNTPACLTKLLLLTTACSQMTSRGISSTLNAMQSSLPMTADMGTSVAS